MSNDAVYATTGVRTLEQYIGDARMRLLGHVLRLDRQAPAQQSMDLYVSKGSRQVGRPRACLASSVAKDLKEVGLKLSRPDDLARLRECAADRKAWRELVITLNNKRAAPHR